MQPKLSMGTIIGRLYLPFALVFFLSVLFRAVNSVLSPELTAEFNLTAADLGMMTSAYLFAFAFAQYPLGIALDTFGARRTLAALMIIACTGALFFAQATSLSMLVIGRALIGLGVSGCLMAAFKSFSEWLPEKKLPLANCFSVCRWHWWSCRHPARQDGSGVHRLARHLHLPGYRDRTETSTYFFAFVLAQIPIGIALDHYGPRRTLATLLLFATAGALVFRASLQPV